MTTEAKMSFTPATLKSMMDRAVARETKRVIEEITARAEVERSLGNIDTGTVLDEVAEGLRPLDPKKPDLNKLLVKGLEDAPRTSYFATDSEDGDMGDGELPAVQFRDDESDIKRMLRG